jgi:hypothetical protein
MVIDGLIVVVVLGVLAAPYVLPAPKIRPHMQHTRLMISGPAFGQETDGGIFLATATLTFSNVGPTDVQCDVEWFDCRARENVTVPELYQVPSRTILVVSGATRNVTLVGSGSSNCLGGRIGCYAVHWRQRPPWLARTLANHRRLGAAADEIGERLWGNGSAPWQRTGEEDWAFAANTGVAEYFRTVFALDLKRFLTEELAEQEARKAAFEEAQRDASTLKEKMEARWTVSWSLARGPRSARQEARSAFGRWLREGGGCTAEPVAPREPPAAPVRTSP